MLMVFGKAWREQRRQLVILPLTTMLTVLYFGQVFIGALEVTRPQRYDLVALHGFTAISLWIALGGLLVACAVLPHEGEPRSIRPSGDSGQRISWRSPSRLSWACCLPPRLPGWSPDIRVGRRSGWHSGHCWAGRWPRAAPSALNQYIDRDLDKNMQRTARRPLPSGRLLPPEGLAFGLGLCLASYYLLAGLVNLLAALLSLAGIFYYVILYSLWLKKATTQNIVIGGGAGSYSTAGGLGGGYKSSGIWPR